LKYKKLLKKRALDGWSDEHGFIDMTVDKINNKCVYTLYSSF